MSWIGIWKNQYGSIVNITNDADNRITSTFRTVLKDSGFFGQEVAIIGIHQGDCISFVCGSATKSGDMAVSYTGLLRKGKLETLWYVVADSALKASTPGAPAEIAKLSWWCSMTTSADTFERQ